MVHIAKRMRSFQPLLKIKYGDGAAILPPHPAPQLKSLTLRQPRGRWRKDLFLGPSYFRKNHLASLQYTNPTLPITVEMPEWDGKESITLTLQFEGNDPEALRAIAQRSSNPFRTGRKQPVIQQEDDTVVTEGQSPNFRDAPSREVAPKSDARRTADDDEVTIKSQPSSSVAGTPSQPVYTRSVSLPLNGRSAQNIWKWFEMRTQCTKPVMTPEDAQLQAELAKSTAKSAEDRQRVKAAMDAMRREKADLKRAKEAAERLTAEASL